MIISSRRNVQYCRRCAAKQPVTVLIHKTMCSLLQFLKCLSSLYSHIYLLFPVEVYLPLQNFDLQNSVISIFIFVTKSMKVSSFLYWCFQHKICTSYKSVQLPAALHTRLTMFLSVYSSFFILSIMAQVAQLHIHKAFHFSHIEWLNLPSCTVSLLDIGLITSASVLFSASVLCWQELFQYQYF